MKDRLATTLRRRGTPLLHHLPALLTLLSSALPLAVPAPFVFTDIYTPRCKPLADPPPKGFQKWSNPKTWPSGVVPGVGKATMVNVTIPCNQAVLLDVANIRVNMLQIQGLLKVEDPVKAVKYRVTACFVLVEGQLHIGTSANHFKSKIVFSLAANPFNRQEYSGSFNPPADKNNPRKLGHKGFVVMGGYVNLHGMPGGGDSPSWVKLAATALKGQTFIVVDKDVTNFWPVGSKIALAPTGFYDYEAEEVAITAVVRHPKGSQIILSKQLQYEHFGDPLGVPDGFGGFVDETGEVALLSRNIMITGVDEKPPHQYEGGHFMIFFTQTAQTLEGVEFWLMGQQGNLGRYNIHLHVCGDVRNRWIIRKNSMHDSKQRCVVVHATHNVTIDSNVAYNTSGHCYMVEEGGEMDNLFINNLGFRTRKVDILIPDGPTPGSSLETDVVPSTFWISNMRNRFIGNVAAGSEETGFWAELRPTVRGFSQYLPSIKNIAPAYTPILEFRDNVAHSNIGMGFRCYPNGVNPRTIYDLTSKIPKNDWPDSRGIIRNFRCYKNANEGFFMHASSNVYVVNGTFADNKYGVAMRQNMRGGVLNSRFVGVSKNLGTLPPLAYCSRDGGEFLCGPIKGCKFNGTEVKNLKPTGGNAWNFPTFGILLEQFRLAVDAYTGTYNFSNNRFHAFDSTCKVSAAIGMGMGNNISRDWWNSAVNFKNVTTTAGVNTFWFTPAVLKFPYQDKNFTAGEVQSSYAIQDVDGTLSGMKGAALISNAKVLQPPKGVKCSARPKSNAVVCPKTCYRTVEINYLEDGFYPLAYEDSDERRQSGDFSWLTIRRVSDGVTRRTDGNLNSHSNVANMRFFAFSVFAPAAYTVTIYPPKKKPNFVPKSINVGFRDYGGCTASVTLAFNPIQKVQYRVEEGENTFLTPCPGVKYTVAKPVQHSQVCSGAGQAVRLVLGGSYYGMVTLNREPIQACPAALACGVYPERDWYYYNVSGRELRGSKPGNMGFQLPLYPMPGWKRGRGIIGYAGYEWDEMRTKTPMPTVATMTYYYRKTFSVAKSACYSGLTLDYIQIMGLVAYLNGVEIFRHNLPTGPLTAATPALKTLWWPGDKGGTLSTVQVDLTKSKASLVQGVNYLAFETHLTSGSQAYSYFDTRLSLNISRSAGCKGAKKSAEVCDALDNNADGRVDTNPVTKKLLTRPCSTACGTGTETCLLGAYSGCTARRPTAELCNGKDDDCDGLIDNGKTLRMNCAVGSVCFQGQCQPVTQPVARVPLIPRGSAGWLYAASRFSVQSFPNWITGSPAAALKQFTAGRTPFSTVKGRLASSASTRIATLASPKSQYYFLYRFTLSAAQVQETQSLSVNARRDQGLVVLSNGVEVLRNNLFSWYDPKNPDHQFATSNLVNTDVTQWYSNPASSAKSIRAGQNWIAVVVAINPTKSTTGYFDLEVMRNMNRTCASLPGAPKACLRTWGTPVVLMQYSEKWKYLDALKPLPASNWMKPAFNDKAWGVGQAPLGNTVKGKIKMIRDKRVTYFFRKTVVIPDGHCYFNLTVNFQVLDGAIFYVNGAEAYRHQMDPLVKTFLPTYYSSNISPKTGWGLFTLPAGWLKAGSNVLAAELHLSAVPTKSWFFDMSLTGRREDITCKPAPKSK